VSARRRALPAKSERALLVRLTHEEHARFRAASLAAKRSLADVAREAWEQLAREQPAQKINT
jgi:hypothetical protein